MRKNIIVAMASLAFLPAVSFAAAPTLSEVLDASGISVTGHVSGSYAYDRASISGGGVLAPPATGTSASDNQFSFDQAELTISKLPAEGFGALVDIYGGQDVKGGTYNYLSGTSGAPVGPSSAIIYPTSAFNTLSGGSEEINLHQAYVQYATGGLTVIGGKFATLAGYEVASDALNINATRSILFSQQAFTLTGVRAGYKFNDIVTAYVGLSNSGLGGTVDADTKKTTELGVALAPLAGLTVNVTDYIGTDGTVRNNLLDLVTAYTAGNLTVALNGDYNTNKQSGVLDNKTSGLALYGNYQITSAYNAGARLEYVQQKDKIADATINRKAITLSGGYAATKNFSLMTDLRYARLTGSGSSVSANLSTAVLKAVYKF